jgi:hypothetical protein
MQGIAKRTKTVSPDIRCILLVDNLRQQSLAEMAGADTVLLSGFSAWEFLLTVENLLPRQTGKCGPVTKV